MTILEILKRWLTYDRIRVSPSAGEKLRLQVGQRVIMNDSLWIITVRQPLEDGDRVGVRYHLAPFDSEECNTFLPTPPIIFVSDEWARCEFIGSTLRMDSFL
jgi:hypothetical protein